jgi:hypothetical protein
MKEGDLATLATGVMTTAAQIVKELGAGPVSVMFKLTVAGDRTQILAGPWDGSGEVPQVSEADEARRDGRIVVVETVGCALAVLRRLDHTWCDEDVRGILTQVRSELSRAQSRLKERINV